MRWRVEAAIKHSIDSIDSIESIDLIAGEDVFKWGVQQEHRSIGEILHLGAQWKDLYGNGAHKPMQSINQHESIKSVNIQQLVSAIGYFTSEQKKYDQYHRYNNCNK